MGTRLGSTSQAWRLGVPVSPLQVKPALALFVFVSAILLLPSTSSAQEDAASLCLPREFRRQSSACQNGSRTIQYVLDKTVLDHCSDPFESFPARKESCACRPEDIGSSIVRNGSHCAINFLHKGCWLPKNSTTQVQLSEAACNATLPACTDSNLRSVTSKCSAPALPGNSTNSTKSPTQGRFMEVIYYFDGLCDPRAAASVPLPPIAKVRCDQQCGPGYFFKHDKCQPCQPGTFSLGGGERYTFFNSLAQAGLKASCVYENTTGQHPCRGWTARGGRLEVGPIDPANTFSFEECDLYAPFECHNKLKATLSTTVELVRDGYVKFEYTVSAENSFDGLSFFIDSTTTPVMTLESSKMHPTSVNFSMEAGVHTLTWVYSKDSKTSAGQDTASILLLEIVGTSLADSSCTKCQPGYFSPGNSSACLPCPLNMFSGEGAAVCQKCPADSYAVKIPQVNCTKRITCDIFKDAYPSFSPCNAANRTRTLVWTWKEPRICAPGDSIPAALPPPSVLPCPPCPLGQHYSNDPNGTSAFCAFCPVGTQRNATDAPGCTTCGPGEAAVKELTLRQMLALPSPPASTPGAPGLGRLPGGFTTGCSGDCGGLGWELDTSHVDTNGRGLTAGEGELSSGSAHGPSVVVWLALTVDLDRDGDVSFNMSVDIPPGDLQRGFFFHIDDFPVDQIVEDEYDEDFGGAPSGPFLSGPWPLAKGKHRLMWTWMKVHAGFYEGSRDSAVIYSLTVRGSSRGGAKECFHVPDGYVARKDGAGWDPCPAGTFSTGGSGNCTQCPANTFNAAPGGGLGACIPCGHGTSSKAGSTECVVGDVTRPATFCTYKVQEERRGVGGEALVHPLFFDLSPLYDLHPQRPFGPVYSDPTSPSKELSNLFFVSICARDPTNSSCYDFDGNPLNTYACRTDSQGFLEDDRRPGHSIGDRVSIQPLGLQNPKLERRGLTMEFTAGGCPSTHGNRTLSLTFICDPHAAYGEPEAWTEGGKAAAFNPDLGYPAWVNRSGPYIPVEGPWGKCSHSMVWYSSYACPTCWPSDYEAVALSGCPNNTKVTYRYKEPRTCQPHPQHPLPRDIKCVPCSKQDIVSTISECKDAQGKQNATYRWVQPKTCNDNANGSIGLPPDVAAGPCMQTFMFIPSKGITLPTAILLGVVGVGVLVSALVTYSSWRKSRKIYEQYAQLVEVQNSKGQDKDLDSPQPGGLVTGLRSEAIRIPDTMDD